MTSAVYDIAEEIALPAEQADVSRVAAGSIAEVAHIKRFSERYRGDAAFRVRVQDEVSVVAALRDYDLRLSPEDALRYVALEQGADLPLTPALRAYRDFVLDTARTDRVGLLAGRATNARYAAWRRRQVAALRFHFSRSSDAVVRPVAAYELSRGCSVGCWFCAVGAEKLQESFLATEENLTLFHAALRIMRDLFGDAAGSAMCYWATDALDNPDYEVFAKHFAEVNGTFPPTTTALAWKSPERTRALLQTAFAHGTLLNRFSVLSLGMLNRIHATFSAEELCQTELVLQMKDSLVSLSPTQSVAAKKIRAGRARSAARMDADLYGEDEGTVACVIGFLFNFAAGTVRLITPCVPSDEHPLGYRTLETRSGLESLTLGETLLGMVERHMPLQFGDAALRLSPSLSVDVQDGLLTIRSQRHAVALSCSETPANTLHRFVELLRDGTNTAAHVVAGMRRYGMNMFTSNALMHQLREEGVFELL